MFLFPPKSISSHSFAELWSAAQDEPSAAKAACSAAQAWWPSSMFCSCQQDEALKLATSKALAQSGGRRTRWSEVLQSASQLPCPAHHDFFIPRTLVFQEKYVLSIFILAFLWMFRKDLKRWWIGLRAVGCNHELRGWVGKWSLSFWPYHLTLAYYFVPNGWL